MMYLPNRSLYNIEPSTSQKPMSTADKIQTHMANIDAIVETHRQNSALLAELIQQNETWQQAQQKEVAKFAKALKAKKSKI